MRRPRPPFRTIALVLQGGGALGAYQAGVYQGLNDGGIEPDWLAGISIGAINTALIAGSPPAQRVANLRTFWETVCRPAIAQPLAAVMQSWVGQLGDEARRMFNAVTAWRGVVEGQEGFFKPRLPPPWLSVSLPPAEASYYDISPLRTTLAQLVDLERINAGSPRVSVGAVNVRTGNFEYFDNTVGPWKGRLRLEHFMASGALPPGFPPVEIDGEYYWDGGLVSNTPLGHVLADEPRHDTLAFQVDLWSALGMVPTNIWDAQERQKDIQYSSRTRAITDLMAREQELRNIVRELLKYVPQDTRLSDHWCTRADQWACGRQVSVIHLIYQEKEWDGLAKDYEFGPQTMRDHWASGLDDIRASLAHKEWLELPPHHERFVTHDLHRQ
ncbi:patatin-like phospholipase family protein [Aromatoleum toluvorans]|uniref:Patatin-like phospholipase family protein n=1 Tax=Aromatoleum toluvorans TaxID=92002 RepID=A0ABX1PXZ9_9RHOO|nr:patatin-like phospholipase family protein [Aromatoleum toluvorans]NMG43567.1 patatin-like phospholipase family protein [Aromatoleum toluvorans]